MIHRINVFLLSIILIFSQTFVIVSANTVGGSIGGWQVVSNIGQGIGAKLTATKEVIVNGASKVATGTANLTPNPAGVARFMASAGGLALADLAVRELINGVDFVLDPKNNTITYKDPPLPPKTYTVYASYGSGKIVNASASTALDACKLASQQWAVIQTNSDGVKPRVSSHDASSNGCSFYYSYTSNSYQENLGMTVVDNPVTERPPKTIPLSTVASQVIDKAEKDIKAGNVTAAVTLTRSAVIEDAREAETDQTKARPIVQQLEKTQSIPTTETSEGTVTNPAVTDPVTGEVKPVPPSAISLDFPVFCGWAPNVCIAAQTVVDAPAAIKEWVQTESPADVKTEVDIIEPEPPQPTQDYLQWQAYCPFNSESAQITLGNETSDIESDFTSWCTMASEIKPFVLLAGALASLMIVSGVGLGRGDD